MTGRSIKPKKKTSSNSSRGMVLEFMTSTVIVQYDLEITCCKIWIASWRLIASASVEDAQNTPWFDMLRRKFPVVGCNGIVLKEDAINVTLHNGRKRCLPNSNKCCTLHRMFFLLHISSFIEDVTCPIHNDRKWSIFVFPYLVMWHF